MLPVRAGSCERWTTGARPWLRAANGKVWRQAAEDEIQAGNNSLCPVLSRGVHVPGRVTGDGIRTGSASSSDDRELHVVLDGPAQLGRFRQQLRGLLVSEQVAAADREAVVLAAVEALNNALQACRPSACRVEAIVSVIAGYVCIEVRDAGEGAKGACVNLAKPPDEAEEHGRGLYLMGRLMESLELVPRSHGTLVRMTKRLGEHESPDRPEAGCLAS
jgi:anti-sigma regulatory factor (Ser/Thr protein kinase)